MRGIDGRTVRFAIAAGAGYWAAAQGAVSLTRFGGGVACLWIATAGLIAAMSARPRREWPLLLAVCGTINTVVTARHGLGPAAAVPLSAANMAEAGLSIWLMQRLDLRRESMDSLHRLGLLVLVIGVVTPALSAVTGACVARYLVGLDFRTNLINWFTGHALGNITFVPVLTSLMTGAVGRWARSVSGWRKLEAALLLGLVLATAVGVFCQNRLPLLFLPILPVILTTFRIGRLGATGSVVVIALVGGWFTLHGAGPVMLFQGNAAARAQLFQLYLAITVVTALPVAAELRRRRALFDRLSESEARYRLLADNSSDIVLSVRLDGTIRYASPSLQQLAGFPSESVTGLAVARLVVSEDRADVEQLHRDALDRPGETVSGEHRGRTSTGEPRWFESNVRAVVDDRGEMTGTVSVSRDITDRKAMEDELSRAAATDPLTGLPNRRAFDRELERMVSGEAAGCVAIFDLDRFKRINDRWGHEAGDHVIVTFAQIATRWVRDGDTVARLGGEEFGVILPGATADQAQVVCERLRCALRDTPVRVGTQVTFVSASAGLAQCGPGLDRSALMRAADVALYQAKEAGRDRLLLAPVLSGARAAA